MRMSVLGDAPSRSSGRTTRAATRMFPELLDIRIFAELVAVRWAGLADARTLGELSELDPLGKPPAAGERLDLRGRVVVKIYRLCS